MARRKKVHKKSRKVHKKKPFIKTFLLVIVVVITGFFLGFFLANQGKEDLQESTYFWLTEEELAESVEEFKSRIEADPQDYVAYDELAWAYFLQENYDQALSSFRLSASQFGEDFANAHGQGWSLHRLGHYTQAKQTFDRSLSYEKRDVPSPAQLNSLYNGLGFTEHQLGNDGSHWFRLANQQGVDHILTHIGLTMSHHTKGERSAASTYGTNVRLYFEAPQLVSGLSAVFAKCMKNKKYDSVSITFCAEKI